MATLNIVGWEAGDSTEAIATGGTFSVQGTTKRTGQYALRCNPAGSAAGWHAISLYNTSGVHTNMLRTTETWYTFYLRLEDIPAATVTVAGVYTASNSPVVRVRVASDGTVVLAGATTSASAATLSADTWYRINVRVTSNSTRYIYV